MPEDEYDEFHDELQKNDLSLIKVRLTYLQWYGNQFS